MTEFAPTPVIILKFRTEKEMRVSFRKILLGNRCYNRTHVSVSLSVFSPLRARSGVARLVSAFQCISPRQETNLLIFF